MAALQNQQFTIYTTGILDAQNLLEVPKSGIIDCWNEKIRQNILAMIPERFDISIYHYDPFKPQLSENEFIIYRDQIDIVLYNSLNLKDLESERVKNSIFYNSKLPSIENIRSPHIVIDNSHIFSYTQIGHSLYTQYYGRNYMGEEDTYIKDTQYKINSIYFGYIGNFYYADRKFSNTYILDSYFFKVNDDDSITTFIDKLIDLRKDSNEFAEYDIEKIYKNIADKIECNFKSLYEIQNGNLNNWLNQFESYFNQNIAKAIIFDIVRMLFIVSSLDELIDIISSKY